MSRPPYRCGAGMVSPIHPLYQRHQDSHHVSAPSQLAVGSLCPELPLGWVGFPGERGSLGHCPSADPRPQALQPAAWAPLERRDREPLCGARSQDAATAAELTPCAGFLLLRLFCLWGLFSVLASALGKQSVMNSQGKAERESSQCAPCPLMRRLD